MKYLKLFLILFTLAFTVSTVAQDRDVSPVPYQKHHSQNIEAIWDVELNIDITAATGAAGNAGGEFDGTYFYTTRWASNLIHKYSNTGALIEQFTIPGVTGLRDLAFDGTYMYGGANANTIYKMDFVTKTLISTITSPLAVRNIAYDAANDAFWVGNWDTDLVLVSRTGTTIASIPAATHGFAGMYGTDWDNVSPGGPYLWVFDQGGGAGLPQIIHQLQLPSGISTGVTHDVITDISPGDVSAIAGALFGMSNFVPGKYSLGGVVQGTPDRLFVYEIATTGPPCPVGAATNPTPAANAVNVSINVPTLSWTNPTGGAAALRNDVFFGDNAGTMTLIHSGSLVSSVPVPGLPLQFNKKYYWKVVEKNDTCSGNSAIWSFTTVQNPNLAICDDFTAFNWTIYGPLGLTNWGTNPTANAGGTSPELRLNWSPQFVGDSWILSPMVVNAPAGTPIALTFRHMVDWYSTTFTLNVGYTTNGGTSFTTLWTINPTGNVGPEVVTVPNFNSPGNFQFAIGFSGDSFELDYWYIDDFCAGIVPVELTSFTANSSNNNISLNWSTATETNNKGFEIERSLNNGEFTSIAFVDGFGTTAQTQNYSYTDRGLGNGNYTYRLKQIDFNGRFEYSPAIQVDLNVPAVFSLDQNYPNPFNPTTNINFSLAVDSRVTLKVFDVLGQEVANLVNSDLTAGFHTVTFNASNINSGVYFYQIEAKGNNGTTFSSVKKMILTK